MRKIIDPSGSIVKLLLYREHCTRLKNKVLEAHQAYVKDLKILRGVDLKNILIVDNSVACFLSYLHNGVPILPYKATLEDDCELQKLGDYLVWLHQFWPTIAIKNSEYFKLHVGLRLKQLEDSFPEMFKVYG